MPIQKCELSQLWKNWSHQESMLQQEGEWRLQPNTTGQTHTRLCQGGAEASYVLRFTLSIYKPPFCCTVYFYLIYPNVFSTWNIKYLHTAAIAWYKFICYTIRLKSICFVLIYMKNHAPVKTGLTSCCMQPTQQRHVCTGVRITVT